jgi:tryptophan-rich sensory protein
MSYEDQPRTSSSGTVIAIVAVVVLLMLGGLLVLGLAGLFLFGGSARSVSVPFAINFVANLIFTPIQFGLRNLPLASVDILVVWTTIIGTLIVTWPHYRWVAVAQVPYLIWVSLATVLQLSITWMNWGRP